MKNPFKNSNILGSQQLTFQHNFSENKAAHLICVSQKHTKLFGLHWPRTQGVSPHLWIPLQTAEREAQGSLFQGEPAHSPAQEHGKTLLSCKGSNLNTIWWLVE